LSEQDRIKWDQKYAGDDFLFGEEASLYLVEVAAQLPPTGRALDIASGEGQNAVYLAQRGLSVTALDISAMGLRKAKILADKHGVALELRLWDLERSLLPPGPFDAIVCMHYKQQSLAPRITQALAPGGVLLMELATVKNLERHQRPPRPFLVESNELMCWFPELVLVSYEERLYDNRFVAQLVARKPV
jgi:2-polyprenyl-3-methyl-5-hydroxy-6-metoxy-1,4-benzoquinol methylase